MDAGDRQVLEEHRRARGAAERRERRIDALKTFLLQAFFILVLWFLAPRWRHLREILAAIAAGAQLLQSSMHLWVREWVFAHADPGPDLHADGSPREWFPRPGPEEGEGWSKARLLFKGTRIAVAACEAALVLLVLSRLIPGVSGSMERLFWGP